MNKRLSKKQIIAMAKLAGMPPGWYGGPWFDDKGRLHDGMPRCLAAYTRLVETWVRQNVPRP